MFCFGMKMGLLRNEAFWFFVKSSGLHPAHGGSLCADVTGFPPMFIVARPVACGVRQGRGRAVWYVAGLLVLFG